MTPRTRAFGSLVCSTQSHLSLSLLMDPVSELHHLRVDAGAVQPRAALTPAHDPCQEPPPATFQTHQRAPGITLGDTSIYQALLRAVSCLREQKTRLDWVLKPLH